MKTVSAWAVGIPFQNDSLHVIEQHLAWHTAKIGAGANQSIAYRVEILTDAKMDETHPAIAKRCDKRRQWRLAPEGDEIDLHLLAGHGPEADNGTAVVLRRFHRRQKGFELGDGTRITLLTNLAQQNGRRQPRRMRLAYAFSQIRFGRVQLRSP